MNFKVVFDVSQQGFQGWQMIGIGLILTVVGALLVSQPDLMATLLPSGPQGRARAIFSKIFFYGSLIWTVSVSAIAGFEYWQARYDLSDGHYLTVEGPVTNLEHDARQEQETFSVQGVHFSYINDELTPGFHTTAAYNGPIRKGLHVRVTYTRNLILRLEVCNE